jgi:hypothetical protein
MCSWHERIRRSSRFGQSTSGAIFWVVVLLAVAAVIVRFRSQRAKAPKPQSSEGAGLRAGDGLPCALGMPAIAALMAAVT